MKEEIKVTPMMRQFLDIKKEYPDSLLFFRMGDFYEMFYEDARIASRLLGLTLTKRAGVPMCGVPHHASENYLSKLIKLGRKVAICDQVEDPKIAKGIVKREVTEVITPGTVTESNYLDNRSNNYLISFIIEENEASICAVDISTSEFLVTTIKSENTLKGLADEITRFSPSEILLPSSYEEYSFLQDIKRNRGDIFISFLDDWCFEYSYAEEKLIKHFKLHSLKGFGLEGEKSAVCVCGGVLSYLSNMQKNALSHITTLSYYQRGDYMLLDEATQTSLEITKNLQTGAHDRTLLAVMDKTLTPMGARRLSKFLLRPLTRLNEIVDRQSRVGFFYDREETRIKTRVFLEDILDLERLCTKLSLLKINPKEILSLKTSLEKAIELIVYLSGESYDDERFASVEECRKVVDLISKAIVDDPPINVNEGGIIRNTYDETLKKYNEALREGRKWISDLESKYREETKNTKLKIRYNNVIGYFVEVSKIASASVPNYFLKRQTLVGSERYTTEELSKYEETINEAGAKSFDLEYKIFCSVRESIRESVNFIKTIAQSVSDIDVFSSLAQLAFEKNYCRAEVDNGDIIDIKGGRHPVVEEYLSTGAFIPNDTMLNNDESRLLLITGPNMSGKSTYLRQTALITLMAQAGSFVPAESARIGIVDRIFTRVGASDSIARGESTFLVEMNETANILNNSTNKSLIIMDEIGRGTSTYDGMSIAWAIIEYLNGTENKQGKTLFATHYHELTLLEKLYGVKNYSVLVREHNGDIVFMKRVVEGPAKSSYGIYAAKIAGVPKQVTTRAEEILKKLEEDGQVQVSIIEKKVSNEQPTLPLFNETEKSDIEKALEDIDPNTLTPIQALSLIAEWKKML